MNNGTWARGFSIRFVSGVEDPLGPRDDCSSGQMQLATYVENSIPVNGLSELEVNIIRQPPPPIRDHQNDISFGKQKLRK
ncbi:hypothetical protein PTKIN_Ptkin14bG0221800 [Pterospermum kingtungense]